MVLILSTFATGPGLTRRRPKLNVAVADDLAGEIQV